MGLQEHIACMDAYHGDTELYTVHDDQLRHFVKNVSRRSLRLRLGWSPSAKRAAVLFLGRFKHLELHDNVHNT